MAAIKACNYFVSLNQGEVGCNLTLNLEEAKRKED